MKKNITEPRSLEAPFKQSPFFVVSINGNVVKNEAIERIIYKISTKPNLVVAPDVNLALGSVIRHNAHVLIYDSDLDTDINGQDLRRRLDNCLPSNMNPFIVEVYRNSDGALEFIATDGAGAEIAYSEENLVSAIYQFLNLTP